MEKVIWSYTNRIEKSDSLFVCVVQTSGKPMLCGTGGALWRAGNIATYKCNITPKTPCWIVKSQNPSKRILSKNIAAGC